MFVCRAYGVYEVCVHVQAFVCVFVCVCDACEQVCAFVSVQVYRLNGAPPGG